MRLEVWAGAGAPGGVAAGLVLLSACAALAAEPAAMTGRLTGEGLHAVGDAGGLASVETGRLKPIAAQSVTPVTAMPAYGAALVYGAQAPNPGDPLTCLAQAVYFEARSESEAGQEAVAQVVMNRTHLPQYATTVCGVVYQGAERTTGCQFTFVCDGSLRAPDDIVAWDRAIGVAQHALDGFIYKPMLGATHYHAAWMTPYWASSLSRIRRIGGQIFYH